MSDHFIELCKRCEGLISQCRCPGPGKRVISTKLCEQCESNNRLAKTAVADQKWKADWLEGK